MRPLWRVERPLWISREGRGWVWQCRVCPPPACYCAQDAKSWDEAMTDSHQHLDDDHRRPALAAVPQELESTLGRAA